MDLVLCPSCRVKSTPDELLENDGRCPVCGEEVPPDYLDDENWNDYGDEEDNESDE